MGGVGGSVHVTFAQHLPPWPVHDASLPSAHAVLHGEAASNVAPQKQLLHGVGDGVGFGAQHVQRFHRVPHLL